MMDFASWCSSSWYLARAQPTDLMDAAPDKVSAAMRGLRGNRPRMSSGWSAARRKAAALHTWPLCKVWRFGGRTGQIPVDFSRLKDSLAEPNNLLPEQFETDRLRSNLNKIASSSGRPLDEEIAARKATSAAGRSTLVI